MAGVKGAGGPIPKRAAQRRNKTKPAIPEESAPAVVNVEAPPVDESWSPIARDWYESLGQSGQSAFYVASDWQQARVLAALLSKAFAADELSASLIAQFLKGSTELMTTEGARRRLRIELAQARKTEVVPDVAHIDEFRHRLGAG